MEPDVSVDASSRRRLLDSGAILLATKAGTLVRGALTAGLVSSTAGLARRTFYDQFSTTADYSAALFEHLTDEVSANSDVALSALLDQCDGDIGRLVTRLVGDHLRESRASSVDQAVLVVRVLNGARPMVAARRSAPWLDLVETVAEVGFVPRQPFTTQDVVRAIDAVLTGLRVTCGVGGDGAEEIGSAVVTGTLLSMMRLRADDERSTPDETMSRQVARAWRERGKDQPVLHVRRLVLDAVAEQLATRGAFGIDLSVISERTGLSTSAITRYVGDLRGVLDALLQRVHPGLEIALAHDLQEGVPPEAAIEYHVERVVGMYRQHPEYAEAELALAFVDRTHENEGTSGTEQLLRALALVIGRMPSAASADLTASQLARSTQLLACVFALDPGSGGPYGAFVRAAMQSLDSL